MVVEVEREVGKKKKGWEVKDTPRDKSKTEEARPLHNNIGDLTLLHCSSSASDKRDWQADDYSDYSTHIMQIMLSDNVL